MSERHREALAHLVYGLNSEGAFILLSGDVGTGKTTVSRCLLEQIPEDTNLALVLNPKVSAQELLDTICDELGISYSKQSPSIKHRVDQINDFLLQNYAQGKRTVVLIDEAQNLETEVLEQLRLLTNLETNEHKLLQIILLGQPELLEILARPELSQLAQRITARYHLSPLDKSEVMTYVSHRLGVAGCHRGLFSKKVLNRLYKLSEGIPRLVNVLCDRALLGAYVQNKHFIDNRTLEKAAREVLGEHKSSSSKNTKWSGNGWLYSISMVLCILLVVVLFFSYQVAVDEKEAAIAKLQSLEVEGLYGADELLSDEKLIIWPEEEIRLRSHSLAFQALFSRWDISYQPLDNGTPCFYAQTRGLSCMDSENDTDLDDLRMINRPAVVSLYDAGGKVYYATLLELDEQWVSLDFSGQEQRISIRQFKDYWRGEFVLLWNRPPGYDLPIMPGYQGETVRWLIRKLNLINQSVQLPEISVYTPVHVEMIRQFQLSQGIKADGIVGKNTLIQINNVTGVNSPRLWGRS
ncbi:MAG: AAA family ATPase [Gammaproteobacteria bacterium]|nr:AAA family ATPase [Gammaproteobacteria bacterium]